MVVIEASLFLRIFDPFFCMTGKKLVPRLHYVILECDKRVVVMAVMAPMHMHRYTTARTVWLFERVNEVKHSRRLATIITIRGQGLTCLGHAVPPEGRSGQAIHQVSMKSRVQVSALACKASSRHAVDYSRQVMGRLFEAPHNSIDEIVRQGLAAYVLCKSVSGIMQQIFMQSSSALGPGKLLWWIQWRRIFQWTGSPQLISRGRGRLWQTIIHSRPGHCVNRSCREMLNLFRSSPLLT